MTVALTYDSQLSRIRIRADGLDTARVAQVERSVDQIRWKPVRGGADVPVPVGGLELDGVAGNYASTPDTAALDIVGDLDIRADVTLDDWTGNFALVGKYATAGNQRGYLLEVFEDGLFLTWSATGAVALFAEATVALSTIVNPGERMAVRATIDVDNGAAGRTVTFYTARNIDDGWVQLGAAVVQAGVTSIFNNTSALFAGVNGGVADTVVGTVHAVEVRSGIGGTIVADPWFFDDAPTGASSFVDGAGLTWTVSGTAVVKHREVVVDDYEFAADRTNYYRVLALQTIEVVRGAAASHANNLSVVPALPEAHRAGDLLMVFGAIRNSGTGTADEPTDYDNVAVVGNLRISGRVHDGSEAAPTQSFTGGVANATTSAMMARVRGVDTSLTQFGRIGVATALNGSAQNIATPSLGAPAVDGTPADGCLIMYVGWKQDDWTSVASPGIEVQEGSSTTGDDQGIVWSHTVQTDAAAVPASSFVVTGGAAAISRSAVLAFAPATTVQTASMYPQLESIWLKSVMRSFLNRPWTLLYPGGDEIGRPGRGADFPVASRTLPVAVTELGGGRQLTLIVRTTTREETRWLDYLVAAGDVVFLHAPADCDIPSLYARIDAAQVRRIRPTGQVWHTVVPLREVAAPGPDIVTASATWDTILAQYADFTALAADFATFDELLELVGDPSEVIVE